MLLSPQNPADTVAYALLGIFAFCMIIVCILILAVIIVDVFELEQYVDDEGEGDDD